MFSCQADASHMGISLPYCVLPAKKQDYFPPLVLFLLHAYFTHFLLFCISHRAHHHKLAYKLQSPFSDLPRQAGPPFSGMSHLIKPLLWMFHCSFILDRIPAAIGQGSARLGILAVSWLQVGSDPVQMILLQSDRTQTFLVDKFYYAELSPQRTAAWMLEKCCVKNPFLVIFA